MTDIVSSEYKQQLIELHQKQNWGASGYSHAETVYQFCKQLKAQTILDFGCGRGTLAPNLAKLGFSGIIYEYDPGIPGKDDLPQEPVELLVATDVLEHFEPDKLDVGMKLLRELTTRGAFFIIATDKSKVSLPDGRNAHLIIENRKFWLNKLNKHNFRVMILEERKGLWIWCR